MIAFELAFLLAASISDIKTKEVPLWLTLPPILLYPLFMGVMKVGDLYFLEGFASGLAIFLLLLWGAWVFNLGGADVLIGTSIGLYLGIYGFYALLVGFALTLPYLLFTKIKHKDGDISYAFVPYLSVGCLCGLLIMYLQNTPIMWWG